MINDLSEGQTQYDKEDAIAPSVLNDGLGLPSPYDKRQNERESLGDAIVELLLSYRLTHTHGDDDSGYPLADALTPPGAKSITLGLEEIELLAGELVWLVIPADVPNKHS